MIFDTCLPYSQIRKDTQKNARKPPRSSFHISSYIMIAFSSLKCIVYNAIIIFYVYNIARSRERHIGLAWFQLVRGCHTRWFQYCWAEVASRPKSSIWPIIIPYADIEWPMSDGRGRHSRFWCLVLEGHSVAFECHDGFFFYIFLLRR